MYLDHSNHSVPSPSSTEPQTSHCISLPISCPPFMIFIYLPICLSIIYLFVCFNFLNLFSAVHMYMVMGYP